MIATEKGPVLQKQNVGRFRITVQPGKGDGMFLIFQQNKVNENIAAIIRT